MRGYVPGDVKWTFVLSVCGIVITLFVVWLVK